MTSKFSNISQGDVERWVGSASFKKGQAYFHQETIFNSRRQGQVLKARCWGSQAEAYHVEAKLGSREILSAKCSCPVGAGGRCKHVAALLLTWLDEPDDFKEIEALDKALEKRSKSELIALIHLMLEREPDLEILLEMPIPGETAGTERLDAEVIRKQVEHAFQSSGYDWGWASPVDIVRDLKPLFDLARYYAEQRNFENAAKIYAIVAGTALDYGDAVIQDEEGDLIGILWDCVEGLGGCLEGLADPDQRKRALRTIFDILAWDVLEAGGIGVSDEAPDVLVQQAKPQERQEIVHWIQAAMPSGDSWSDNYHRQVLGGLQLSLQEDQIDDETFLDICRQTGRIHDLVDRLLALQRVDEAAQEAGQAGDYDLLGLADIFVQHGQDRLAQRLMLSRAETSKDTRLAKWLKDYARQQGNLPEALRIAEKLFWMQPSVGSYAEMRKLAEPLDRWEQLCNGTREKLAKKGMFQLLTEIYLADREIDLALETLEKARAASRYGVTGSLQSAVAEAAREDRPREAIRLYLQFVQSLIGARGRGNYAQAAAYLKQVKELYHRMGEPHRWEGLIAELREAHRNLPALQDELNRARL